MSITRKRPIDYSLITEAPGLKATQEQVARLGQRYWFARRNGNGRRILEVACGTGLGLGYLTNHGASWVVGGELDITNLTVAKKIIRPELQVALVRLDAQFMPFRSASFNEVVCFEALYYFAEPEQFLKEAFRVLKPKGTIVLSTVNCAWPDFHPSPFTHRYFNSFELFKLLRIYFDPVELYGGFPVTEGGLRNKVLSGLKRTAVATNLIPGSLRARSVLKRLFMGPLSGLPSEVSDQLVPDVPPWRLSEEKIDTACKILYALACKG